MWRMTWQASSVRPYQEVVGKDLDELLARELAAVGVVHVVGPDREWSPRHVLPFNLRNKGLQCGG